MQGLDWNHFAQDRDREHRNKSLGSMKSWEFLYQPSNYYLLCSMGLVSQ